jgi:hypothetical protein
LPVWLAAVSAVAQVSTPALDQQLSDEARQLSDMPFDPALPITVRGRIATLVWPRGTDAMILLEINGGHERFAFSTAKVPQLAKLGFTRSTLHPGEEIVVSGILAGGRKIGAGFTAARADLITKADGARVFDRTQLASRSTHG